MIVDDFICFECEHWYTNNKDGLDSGCRAFPNGMPYKYPLNNKHDKPFDNQKGDFVFKQVLEKDRFYGWVKN
ncbi:MAG: hypothetical protein LBN74_01905 [Prevotella sp.]|nr:hypothetical protein [Prevotella sp.]